MTTDSQNDDIANWVSFRLPKAKLESLTATVENFSEHGNIEAAKESVDGLIKHFVAIDSEGEWTEPDLENLARFVLPAFRRFVEKNKILSCTLDQAFGLALGKGNPRKTSLEMQLAIAAFIEKLRRDGNETSDALKQAALRFGISQKTAEAARTHITKTYGSRLRLFSDDDLSTLIPRRSNRR